jgi:MFS family permease
MVEWGLCVAGKPSHLAMDLFGLCIGGATMVLYTLAISQTNDRAGLENVLVVSAGLLFLYCVGATLAPLLASFLMEQFGPQMLFAQNGATHLIMAVFAMWRMMVREPAVNAPRPDIPPKSAALAR